MEKYRLYKDKNMVLLFFIGVIFIGGLVFLLVLDIIDMNKVSKYCEEKGYDGYEGDSGGRVCYNLVHHESGIGMDKVYSGEIIKEVLED